MRRMARVALRNRWGEGAGEWVYSLINWLNAVSKDVSLVSSASVLRTEKGTGFACSIFIFIFFPLDRHNMVGLINFSQR